MDHPNTGPGAGHADRLRGAGLKATGPRLAILAALEQDKSHPSAEQIHAGLAGGHPSLSLSTVYSTLEAFVRAGLVRKVNANDGRLRVDGTCEDHDHAVCRSCGTIFDVDRSWYPLPQAPARLPRGLDVVGVHVEYDVICNACRQGAQSTESPPPSKKGRTRALRGPGLNTSFQSRRGGVTTWQI